jgi:hypothetical protein
MDNQLFQHVDEFSKPKGAFAVGWSSTDEIEVLSVPNPEE